MAMKDMNKVTTSTLLRRLFKTTNLKEYIENNAHELQIPSFHEYISELCKVMNQVPEQIIRNSSIERTYGHQLFNGTRKPSRDKVIQLAFGFGLNIEGTQNLLRIAQKSILYPRIKRDAAILYCISHDMGILEAQGTLHDLHLTLLGGSEENE